jgi:hypothetical protein
MASTVTSVSTRPTSVPTLRASRDDVPADLERRLEAWLLIARIVAPRGASALS